MSKLMEKLERLDAYTGADTWLEPPTHEKIVSRWWWFLVGGVVEMALGIALFNSWSASGFALSSGSALLFFSGFLLNERLSTPRSRESSQRIWKWARALTPVIIAVPTLIVTFAMNPEDPGSALAMSFLAALTGFGLSFQVFPRGS